MAKKKKDSNEVIGERVTEIELQKITVEDKVSPKVSRKETDERGVEMWYPCGEIRTVTYDAGHLTTPIRGVRHGLPPQILPAFNGDVFGVVSDNKFVAIRMYARDKEFGTVENMLSVMRQLGFIPLTPATVERHLVGYENVGVATLTTKGLGVVKEPLEDPSAFAVVKSVYSGRSGDLVYIYPTSLLNMLITAIGVSKDEYIKFHPGDHVKVYLKGGHTLKIERAQWK
jgi:hypothetical protein|nr:MAG TPA_asm: hypothetical protein [Caudoviricetes sp.]